MNPRALRVVALCATLASGCALAMPTATFGSTTPELRTDVVGGGAVRIARGDLRAASNDVVDVANHRASVDSTGIVPVVAARYGIGDNVDLGIVASGTGARFDVRFQRIAREGSTRVAIVYGLGPSYTYVVAPSNTSGAAHLVALEPTIAIAVDFGSLYEAWAGPRLTLGGLFGQFEDAAAVLRQTSALRLQAGGVFGIAAGIRRVHGFVELSVLREQWWGSEGSVSLDRGGLVLIPAFGLRIRI